MPTGEITVLVVDDEPGVRRLVVRILERAGLRVIAAEDAEQARARFREERDAIDLLLTDVVMPGLSGPELAQQLSGERPGLKVLFMSGFTAGDVDGSGAPGTTVNLIRKPFTPEELLARVRATLAG